jgi:hypothetical protein
MGAEESKFLADSKVTMAERRDTVIYKMIRKIKQVHSWVDKHSEYPAPFVNLLEPQPTNLV